MNRDYCPAREAFDTEFDWLMYRAMDDELDVNIHNGVITERVKYKRDEE